MTEPNNNSIILDINPEQQGSAEQLLTESERHKLLVEWNNTSFDYPKDKCIHQLFEATAELTPEAVAIVSEGEQLTYGELNARANQLAHYLQALGVGPEVLVGICVERSLEMVVGLLGILKAGGAYVPFDPAYPPERLACMLEDSSVPVLLTKLHLTEKLPLQSSRVVYLDKDSEEIAQHSKGNLRSKVTPDNLAYAIYTSGSTGNPKGVLLEHRGLLNLVFWHQRAFSVSCADRATLLAGPAFDASVWELWPYLTVGASIYIANEQTRILPQQLRDWLVVSAITISFLPTPLAESLLLLNWPVDVALRTLLTGGDKLHNYPLPKVPFELVNNYGPTENTVVTTSGFIPVRERTDIAPPIGRPIANTQVYLLDEKLQPVPIGVPGELYIGGDGLARGYLNRPDLTFEKFISNPFTDQPGSRLYKTGDLARYMPDGNIEFLGRIDSQVKIRGFRIELGEIEVVLAQHPDVCQAVVICREDISGNKRLVAYLVPKVDAVHLAVPISISDLRSFLLAKLPDYMIPGAFVFLSAIPLTPNGKVDRCALPAPNNSLGEMEDQFVAPSTPAEKALAAIWAEVLGLQQVGINDNFFELGGHSILATQITSRIYEAFKVELPLHHIFDTPTVASLGKVIDTVCFAKQQGHSRSEIAFGNCLPLKPTTRGTYIPLSVSQEYIWHLQHSKPDSCLYNCGIAVRFNGSLCSATLEKSINEIIRRHEILRTTFTVEEGQPLQVINLSLNIPLKILDLQHLPLTERETEAQKLCSEEYQHHFNLATSPLIKATLIRLTQEKHWLLIATHHLITDGWSLNIILKELNMLYNAYFNKLPSPLLE